MYALFLERRSNHEVHTPMPTTEISTISGTIVDSFIRKPEIATRMLFAVRNPVLFPWRKVL